jgi:hypothetical protein
MKDFGLESVSVMKRSMAGSRDLSIDDVTEADELRISRSLHIAAMTVRNSIRDTLPQLTTIGARDVDDFSCSHAESFNSFRLFGNRPNESDHQEIT